MSTAAEGAGAEAVTKVLKRLDYTPPPFLVDTVDLRVDLGEDWT